MGQLQENKLVTEFAPSPPLQNVGTVTGNIAGLAGGVQYCRASRKLLADSEWGNQGKFQTHSKSQKNGQIDSNRIEEKKGNQSATLDYTVRSSDRKAK
jgi:hypothetical protein